VVFFLVFVLRCKSIRIEREKKEDEKDGRTFLTSHRL